MPPAVTSTVATRRAAGETAVLEVTAGIDDPSWVYDVDFVLRVDGRDVVERQDNDGRHFRISSTISAKRYQWIDDQWQDIDLGGGPPR